MHLLPLADLNRPQKQLYNLSLWSVAPPHRPLWTCATASALAALHPVSCARNRSEFRGVIILEMAPVLASLFTVLPFLSPSLPTSLPPSPPPGQARGTLNTPV